MISNYITELKQSKQYGIGIKNRHIDQWNSIESPEVKHTHGHFTTKEPRRYNSEGPVSSGTVLGKPDSHMQKNETGSLSYTIQISHNKNYLNEDKRLESIRPETIKLLEENIGRKLLDISLDFMVLGPRTHCQQKQK